MSAGPTFVPHCVPHFSLAEDKVKAQAVALHLRRLEINAHVVACLAP
jgi:hypothetical protein